MGVCSVADGEGDGYTMDPVSVREPHGPALPPLAVHLLLFLPPPMTLY